MLPPHEVRQRDRETEAVVEAQAREVMGRLNPNFQRYEIEVARTQVWKDGDFDPCDIAGWNTIKVGEKSKLPYEDGELVDPSALTAYVARFARKGRLVQDADWFQLVVGVDGDDWAAPTTKKPAGETDPWILNFTANGDGRLSFAANDLKSRIDLVDKYDNNAGWVWAKVTRKA